jgi:4-alpha-glucanotransferase
VDSPKNSPARTRSAGVLLHPTSLPGPYGIGDLGPAARALVDALAGAGQTWWQVLPLTPPGAGDSPYQGFSAFAGNQLLISPDDLFADGLLKRADLRAATLPDGPVEFERVGTLKEKLIGRAWALFRAGQGAALEQPFAEFAAAQKSWLDDFALFMALKEARPDIAWGDWPRELVRREPAALEKARRDLADAVGRQRFAQFLFARQLGALRTYAGAKGILLFGDMPIFISAESADVWAAPGLFRLDERRRPAVVAGVPPDYFSKTGQRWGNPHYDWEAMRRERFAWWVARVRATLAQVDLVRLDHFRGFEASWEIPASCPTAEEGKWVQAPGAELFETMRKELGGLPFVAEDLGEITPAVEELRDRFGLPGMRILQFAFGGAVEERFLPHGFERNCVAYTGTHDNDTTAGWFARLKRDEKRAVLRYTPEAKRDPVGALLRLAWASVADTAITPLQDVLGLGTEARMNVPGTASDNWRWRSPNVEPARLDHLGELTETYGRQPRCAEIPLPTDPEASATSKTSRR